MTDDALSAKVQQQARKLLEQQAALLASIAYSQLVERRLQQLVPSHPIPVTMDMMEEAKALNDVRVEPASRLASLEASLAAMTQRAELAESECEALRNGREPMPRQQPPPQPSSAPPAPTSSADCAVARTTAASRARQLKAQPRPSTAAAANSAAGTAVVVSSSAAGGGSGGGGRVAPSIESMRIERTKLQKALRESREEVLAVRRNAERDIAEARRALEAAGVAAGLPHGAGTILHEHAASQRRLGELSAALDESERRARKLSDEANELREALSSTQSQAARAAEEAARADEAERQLAATEETSLEEASGRKVRLCVCVCVCVCLCLCVRVRV